MTFKTEHIGKQLNCLQLLKYAYKLATADSFGHLIIDLDSENSQGLRFASQIIGPDPSIFHIPAPEAGITTITNENETLVYA